MFLPLIYRASPPALVDGGQTQPQCDASGNLRTASNVGGAAIAQTNPLPVEQPLFTIVGATLTRPANTTAYAANDSVSDNATAGSVSALPVTAADINDAPVILEEILIDTTDTGVAGVQFLVHLFNSDPTSSSGVVGGDNAAWSNKRAGYVGAFIGTFRAFSDGCKGRFVPEIGGVAQGGVLAANPSSGGKLLWYQLQTLGGFTPSANSTTFTARFKGWQGRLAA